MSTGNTISWSRRMMAGMQYAQRGPSVPVPSRYPERSTLSPQNSTRTNLRPTLIHLSRRRRYALVIRGGTVFDGLGGPGIEADDLERIAVADCSSERQKVR